MKNCLEFFARTIAVTLLLCVIKCKIDSYRSPLKAVALLTVSEGPTGVIEFVEDKKTNETVIKVDIQNVFPTGKRGFHIHKLGDLRETCKAAKGHYNPYHMHHGGPNDRVHHLGDLGNVTADQNGNIKTIIRSNEIKLRGPTSVIGRSIMLHHKEDDLGRGGNPESLKTGNANGRVACGVIGLA